MSAEGRLADRERKRRSRELQPSGHVVLSQVTLHLARLIALLRRRNLISENEQPRTGS